MTVPGELIALLKREKAFFIATHINPDGDTLGSALALSSALESMGKKTILYNREHVPERYSFLPGNERIVDSLSVKGLPVVLLDCNDGERAGIDNVSITYSAVIDHHETVRDFGDLRWIEPQSAATGIMVYYLIKELGVGITADMAINLYTAIAVDTGTFRYNNTDAEVMRVSAELVDAGADPASIAAQIYEAWSERRFRLLIKVLNTLEIINQTAITYVTKEMLAETGALPEDTEHFSNFPRMMDHIKVSAFFREIEDGWKVSLRSRGEVDVARIAEGFKGGGHRNAAGYKTRAGLETVKARLLDALARGTARFA